MRANHLGYHPTTINIAHNYYRYIGLPGRATNLCSVTRLTRLRARACADRQETHRCTLPQVAKSLFYQYVMLTCGLMAAIALHALYNVLYCIIPMVVEVTIEEVAMTSAAAEAPRGGIRD